MSPEQIRGQDLDARTDIFSFGCVLYEMATGKAPFARGTAADTISAILKEDPPELTKSGVQIPHEVDRIILHCLEKNPDNRFHSARDLAFDLKEVSSGIRTTGKMVPAATVRPAQKWIRTAVLLVVIVAAAMLAGRFLKPSVKDDGKPIPIAVADFVNETGEKELNGLSGMFITSLEQSKRLSVLTRSRMFDILKQMGKDSVETVDENLGREICRRAGISALVTATVRKFGGLYTIDLKVLDPSGDKYLFAAKEEGKNQESVPDMLDRLSEKTRTGLKENVSKTEIANFKVSQSTTDNLEAYQHYFQGEQDINQLKFVEAVEEFTRATELDPAFAMAFYRLAYAQSWQLNERAVEPMRKAMQNIWKVPEKEQLLFRALFAQLEGNHKESIVLYKQVVQAYPGEKEALWMLGDLSFHTADYPAALEYLQRLVKMDPSFERGWQHLRWTYHALKEHDKALEVAKVYFANVKSPESCASLAYDYLDSGRPDDALGIFQQAAQIFPQDSLGVRGIADVSFYKGDYRKAEDGFLEMTRNPAPDFVGDGYGELINLYAFQGMFKKAFAATDKLMEWDRSRNDKRHLCSNYASEAVGLLRFLKDPAGARRALALAEEYAKDATAEEFGLMFIAYAELGDLQKASEIAGRLEANNPFFRVVISALEHLARKEYDAAIQDLRKADQTGGSGLREFVEAKLAEALVEAGRYDEALEVHWSIQRHPRIESNYPLEFLSTARIHSLKGDRVAEAEDYRTFLKYWKNADPDMPQFREAKSRLAELEKH